MTIAAYHYNPALVALSVLVAVFASYTALELTRRVTLSSGRTARVWLLTGACAMGLGIWSMHFVGMLAYETRMDVSYNIPLTILSMIVAVLSSAFALYVGSRSVISMRRLYTSGAIMGGGIAAMHYTGMAAMVMTAEPHYKPLIFFLSLLIAVVASTAALGLTFRLGSRREDTAVSLKLLTAIIMGIAICGMHYTGMAAVYYTIPTGMNVMSSSNVLDSNIWLAVSIGTATLVLLGFTVLLILFDSRLAVQMNLGLQLESMVKARTSELHLEKKRAEVTLDAIADGVLTTDKDGNVAHLNPVAETLTGWTYDDAVGRHWMDVLKMVSETTRRPITGFLDVVLETGRTVHIPAHTVLIAHDGSEYAIDEMASAVRDSDGHVIGAVVVFRDISQRQEMARKLHFQARHDSLTGLYNRKEFEERLQTALDAVHEYDVEHALLYVDLDHFKIVNDTGGHAVGDELLMKLSVLIRGSFRETDIIARLGGDEFGVIMQDCPLSMAKTQAEKLRRVIEDFRFTWENRVFSVGASIGLVCLNKSCGAISQVLSAADSACYMAKDAGRNQFCIYEEDSEQLAARSRDMDWASKIRAALDDDRFVLYCQKIESIARIEKGRHCEVLLRYLDDEGNILPPMSFIPAAERYFLMPAIDRWVVSKVFDMFAQQTDFAVEANTCSINLSGQSVGEESFLAFIEDRLDTSGIDPRIICFEITETVAITNLQRAQTFINTLRKRGVRFSLDDFGSGMSSFAYLKDLPVDYIKIDGCFVRDLQDDKLDDAIVASICQISKVMGVKTIAEYVEDTRLIDKLTALGVDYAQGFGISRPAPIERVATGVQTRDEVEDGVPAGAVSPRAAGDMP